MRLPANATAAIRQTSLLGEKFVALAAPPHRAGRAVELADGDVIPLSRTSRSAEVEEVLAALGLLLNGGGLAQLQTINAGAGDRRSTGRETDGPGRAAPARHVHRRAGRAEGRPGPGHRRAGPAHRPAGPAARRIGGALDALAPGLTVLAQQRAQLTAALTALATWAGSAPGWSTRSRDDTLASLRALQPILDQLVRAGDDLPKSLDFMLTFPFPPNVTGAIVGDFVNLHVTADLDAARSWRTCSPPSRPPADAAPPARPPASAPKPPAAPGARSAAARWSAARGAAADLPARRRPDPARLGSPRRAATGPRAARCCRPGTPVPPGGLLPPGGILPPGTAFPPGTTVPPGTVLSPGCLLPPLTGAVSGLTGGLTDLLGGGLLP